MGIYKQNVYILPAKAFLEKIVPFISLLNCLSNVYLKYSTTYLQQPPIRRHKTGCRKEAAAVDRCTGRKIVEEQTVTRHKGTVLIIDRQTKKDMKQKNATVSRTNYGDGGRREQN